MKAPFSALRVTGHGRRGLAYVTEGPEVRTYMLRRILPRRQVRLRPYKKGRLCISNGKPTSGRDRGSPTPWTRCHARHLTAVIRREAVAIWAKTRPGRGRGRRIRCGRERKRRGGHSPAGASEMHLRAMRCCQSIALAELYNMGKNLSGDGRLDLASTSVALLANAASGRDDTAAQVEGSARSWSRMSAVSATIPCARDQKSPLSRGRP